TTTTSRFVVSVAIRRRHAWRATATGSMVSRMRKYLGALGLLVPIAAYAQESDEGVVPHGGGTEESAPIINGAEADEDDYPMAGGLLFTSGALEAVLCT